MYHEVDVILVVQVYAKGVQAHAVVAVLMNVLVVVVEGALEVVAVAVSVAAEVVLTDGFKGGIKWLFQKMIL
jgi:hypothetical protein